MQEVRRFSRDLRPSILDDLGLLPALELVTGELRDFYGVKSELKVLGNQRRLPQEAELLVFRIVQEALNNVVKHAGIGRATVTVRFEDGRVLARIADKGRGFVPEEVGAEGQGIGLSTMRERVEMLAGTLHVDSSPGTGTRVTVELDQESRKRNNDKD